MRKKNYESPQMEVASIENMQIMAQSTTPFEDGGTIDQEWY